LNQLCHWSAATKPAKAFCFLAAHLFAEAPLARREIQRRYRQYDQNTLAPIEEHIDREAIAANAPMSSMGVQGTEQV
jgi:hypothetical protein